MNSRCRIPSLDWVAWPRLRGHGLWLGCAAALRTASGSLFADGAKWRVASLVLLVTVLVVVAAEAQDAAARFPAADLARGGRRLPVSFDLVNTSSGDMTELSVTTNQLFRYRLEILLGAGQRGTVSFAPIYFDGRMEFSDVFCRGDSTRQDYRLGALQARPLPADTVLVLFDREQLQPGRLGDHLGYWTEYYFPQPAGAGDRQPAGRVLPQPISTDPLQGLLLIDSAAAALVTSADDPDLGALQTVSRQCELDLSTIDSAANLKQQVVTPPRLRRIAAGAHLRGDLFDRTTATAGGGIAPRLFQYQDWSAGNRARFLVPLVVVAAVILVLALIGGRLATWLKVAALLTVTAGGIVWVAIVLAVTPMQFVDTVRIVYLDLPSGRSYGERLASVISRREAVVQLDFVGVAGGPPRPLMVDDGGRSFYQGATLHRHIEGSWSVEELKVTPRSLLAFGVSRWDAVAFDDSSVSIRMQSGRPRLRLADGHSMQDAWIYLDGRAYRMGDVSGGGSYLPISREPSVDAAAFAVDAAGNEFRKRAMRWIARELYRSEVCILLGWQADAPPVAQAPGATVTSHGRLLVWLIPWPQAGTD